MIRYFIMLRYCYFVSRTYLHNIEQKLGGHTVRALCYKEKPFSELKKEDLELIENLYVNTRILDGTLKTLKCLRRLLFR